MLSIVRYLLFVRTILDPFGRLHSMLGKGLPLALQNRFVSKDSFAVWLLGEEMIFGGSMQDNRKGNY